MRVSMYSCYRVCSRLTLSCSCYTNHALDQILEHLVKDGTEHVIRLGSRSKSDLLEQLTLINVSRRMEHTKLEKKESWECQNQLDAETEEVTELLGELRDPQKIMVIKQFLETNHKEHYHQLFDDLDEDGFRMVGSGHHNPIQAWLRRGSQQRSCRPIATLIGTELRNMSQAERNKLYDYWIRDIEDDLTEKILNVSKRYRDTSKRLEQCRQEVNLRCLQQSHVIGVTTTGLARNLDVLSRLQSKVLICEEAGEVLEAHILSGGFYCNTRCSTC